MKKLINRIDDYLDVQEKKDIISVSFNDKKDINKIINIINKSNNSKKILELFDEEVIEQIKILIEGGIINGKIKDIFKWRR